MRAQVVACRTDTRWPFEDSPEIPVKNNLGPHAQQVGHDGPRKDNEQLECVFSPATTA